jgi:hypothetical protein
MRRKSRPAAKPWVHLVTDDEKPFDQTNGVVDFDTPAKDDGRSDPTDLLGKGVAANTVNVGFFGGGTGF